MSIVDDLVPHMRRVQCAERDLRDLGLLWQMIEASSAISCPEEAESILPMLSQTRERFSALQQRLVQQLGEESLAELRDELAASAQCAIDILVRNLFERTADVGFLATDDTLRGFCTADPDTQQAGVAALRQRLAEYRTKYTVYDDVVLLAPDGRVLARLDPAATLQQSADPVVAAAAARSGYVERFAVSDLGAHDTPALLYAHRVEDAAGRCVGVLVLRFRMADEMAQIFASVTEGQQQMALVLLDAGGRVIASNDEAHVPLGALVQAAEDGQVALTAFAGREYLSLTRATHGYQGYQGPAGWRAHAMVSMLTAFRPRHDTVDERQALSLDNAELARIQTEVDAINGNLRRVVWNGRLVASTQASSQARLKAVLTQVTGAGGRTRARVAEAIRELYRSSLGRSLNQAQSLARLAADIMDRNLYERANDCRWWALSPVLQRVLAAPDDEAGRSALNAMLSHVNSLYTVYSRLVVFDAQGVVRGVSNEDAESPLIGTPVDPALRQATLELNDSQRYAVMPFGPTPLAGGRPTYVYAAAVRPASGGAALGGIAIVFNAEREFRAMLDDVLGTQTGLAAFVDAEGRVIACTSPMGAVGQPLRLTPGVCDREGLQYAVAEVRGGGYREFKRSDGYDNGVRAVVALRLGGLERRRTAHHDTTLAALPVQDRTALREYALFHVGPGRYALDASAVVEARTCEGLVRAPVGHADIAGLLEVPGARGPCVVPVLCGRRLFGVMHPARAGDGVVIVLAGADRRPRVGLRVDHVSTVLDIGPEHQQPAPTGLRQHAPLLAGLLRVAAHGPEGQSGQALVQLVDASAVMANAVPLHAAA